MIAMGKIVPDISTTVGAVPHLAVSPEQSYPPTLSQQQLSTRFDPLLHKYVQWAEVTNTVGPGGLLNYRHCWMKI